MTAPVTRRQNPGRPSRRRRRAGAELPGTQEPAAAPERRAVRPARRVEGGPSTLVIACGALARELLAVIDANRLGNLQVTCLPAILHNRPERIPEAVRAKIHANRGHFDQILCLYGDCGTGGMLDAVLQEEGVERIEGAHCYEFFMGTPDFTALADEEPASFYLTDYLVRHFDRLIIKGLGIDRHPDLLPLYFGNYRRVVHLAQFDDPAMAEKAREAAARLGLPCERRFTGLSGLEPFLARAQTSRDPQA